MTSVQEHGDDPDGDDPDNPDNPTSGGRSLAAAFALADCANLAAISVDRAGSASLRQPAQT
jgi:hypothetical protein